MSSRKANCKWTVSFSATSQIHFIGNLLSSSQEIGFSPCVRLQLWMRFALLLCWLDPPAGLIAVWSPRPVATCQRCSSHIHCSAPAASDKIPFVSFSLTAILSCSYYGPDFFFFFCFVYILLLPITQLFRWQSTDGWLMQENVHVHGLYPKCCSVAE